MSGSGLSRAVPSIPTINPPHTLTEASCKCVWIRDTLPWHPTSTSVCLTLPTNKMLSNPSLSIQTGESKVRCGVVKDADGSDSPLQKNTNVVIVALTP